MRFVASIRIFARAAAAHVSRTAARFAASPAPRRAAFAASAAAGFFASATLTAVAAPAVDYAAVRKAIESYIADNEDMGPTLVRLAWHASGTYDVNTKTGGSNGATMRFSPESAWGANNGLSGARDALAKIKQQHPGITYADLWTLAGSVAIEYMGGPKISWRAGRSDAVDGKSSPPDGTLPAADKGCPAHTVQHIRDIFYRQGFNDQEIVALVGAHSMGRCHTNASGYSGPWTRAPTTFSNMYFKELLDNTWTLKKWNGPDQFEDPTGELMMLPGDMAIIWDKKFREWAVKYRDDEELFFKHFAAAWTKLTENGVKFQFLP